MNINKKTNKNGFTIVELVIVIAVIAILAAVLIPTFSSLVKTAQTSSDISLVKNLNTSLTTSEILDGKNETMTDALNDVKEDGYDVTKLTPTNSDNDILWHEESNRFVLRIKDKYESCGSGVVVDASKLYKLWKIYNEVKELEELESNPVYSIYWNVDADLPKDTELSVGFDAGTTKNVSNIVYKNAGVAKEVVIRTNSYSTVLTIDAEHDTVTHYGKASKVDVTAVDNSHCYNEHGDIAGNINLKKGKVVVHKDCSAGAVVIDMTTAELATVTTLSADNSANKEVPIILNTSEVLWGANPNNDLINPTTNNIIYSSTGGTLPENFNTMTNEQKEAAIASASNNLIQGVAAIKNTGYLTLQAAIDAAQDGDVIVLLADIESSEKVTVNKTITLNMNEKTITGSKEDLVQVGSQTTIGHLTIRGNGSISSSVGKMLTVNPNSTLDIYDGNYVGLKRTFNVLGGKVTTYGGSFSTTDTTADSLAFLGSACYCNFLGGTFTTPTNGNYGICIADASVVNLGAKGEAGPSFSTWRPCIATNGMDSHAATININSGTYKSNRTNSTPDDQSVIQLANDSSQTQTLNVYGGYFEQTSAPNGSVFHVRYHGTININISGGSFKHLGSSLFTGFGRDNNSGWPTEANIRVNVTNNAIAGTQTVLMYGIGGARLSDSDFVVNP